MTNKIKNKNKNISILIRIVIVRIIIKKWQVMWLHVTIEHHKSCMEVETILKKLIYGH